MPIPYEVRPSKLQTGTFYAKVRPGPIFSSQALAEEMASRSGYNVADCVAQISLLEQVARDHLALGENVQIGQLALLALSLKGKLPTAQSEALIADLTVGAKAHRELTEWLRTNGVLQRMDASYTGPFVQSVFNITQNAANKAETGNVLRLTGSNLKFNAAQADEGVFFIPTALGSEVKATVYARNTPGYIELQCPTLAAGNNWLEVRARRFGSTLLQPYRYPTQLPHS